MLDNMERDDNTYMVCFADWRLARAALQNLCSTGGDPHLIDAVGLVMLALAHGIECTEPQTSLGRLAKAAVLTATSEIALGGPDSTPWTNAALAVFDQAVAHSISPAAQPHSDNRTPFSDSFRTIGQP